jgi:hypothetical protein
MSVLLQTGQKLLDKFLVKEGCMLVVAISCKPGWLGLDQEPIHPLLLKTLLETHYGTLCHLKACV